ncbi:MAG: hypothetical protein JRN42_05840, partial [Nitrososphaerota archaeon]|nr:hypothetical protein [Nitrososphaerota archaeon]
MNEETQELWRHWSVALHIDRIYGGVPARKDTFEKWLEMRGFTGAEIKERVREAMDNGTLDEENEGHGLTIFNRIGGEPVIDSYQVKACLREAMTVTGMAKRKRGLKQALQHGVFVEPLYIPLGKEPEPEPEERVVHAMTRMGKIAAFQRSEYNLDADVEFQVKTGSPLFAGPDLATLLEVGAEIG